MAWRRWFKAHDVSPFEVSYNDLTKDAAGVVRSIVELLGVENDEPDGVYVPAVNKQGDETNNEWIERYERETAASAESRPADDDAAGRPSPAKKDSSPAAQPSQAQAASFLTVTTNSPRASQPEQPRRRGSST